jgi:hypothetical protein
MHKEGSARHARTFYPPCGCGVEKNLLRPVKHSGHVFRHLRRPITAINGKSSYAWRRAACLFLKVVGPSWPARQTRERVSKSGGRTRVRISKADRSPKLVRHMYMCERAFMSVHESGLVY